MEKQLGGSSSVQNLLSQMDLPYIERITVSPLPPKFKMPQMDMYEGSKDLIDHLENFQAHITLHDFAGEIACQVSLWPWKGQQGDGSGPSVQAWSIALKS